MFIANKPNCGEVFVKYQSIIPQKSLSKVSSSHDLHIYLRNNVYDEDVISFREEMYLIMMNNSNKIIGWSRISIGGITGTICDPRIVFFHALHCGASKIALSHNHPSGTLVPSHADIKLTKRIKEGADIFDIQLLDHLIIAAEGYYSFADEGLI